MDTREALADIIYRHGYSNPNSERIQPLGERPQWEQASIYSAADAILSTFILTANRK